MSGRAALNRNELDRLFEGMGKQRVLVVGDVMIDAYYWGRVDRISPEAPVPVVQITHREHRLGGAANVALNIKSLGATPVICSVVGDDDKGTVFHELLKQRGFSAEGMITSADRPTTVKTRIISNGQHMLRVDEEHTHPLTTNEETRFLDRCLQLINASDIDVVIFEDYNKGVLTENVIRAVSAKASQEGIPVCVDPKKDNFFIFNNVTLFKPNFKELAEGLKLDLERGNRTQVLAAIDQLEQRLGNAITLVTLSEHGVVIKAGEHHHFIDAHQREILDVSGAGDTVISVASLCLAQRADAYTIATLANLAGGLVCEKVGVVPIEKDRLFSEALKMIES